MTATHIFEGLERSETTGPEAIAAARLGFLEWVFGVEGDATAQTARAALAEPPLQCATSPAARAFVAYLRQATRPMRCPNGRQVRRRRMH